MKRTGILLAVAVLGLCNGCASYLVMKSSEQEVRAIKATQLDGGAGIGIDISAVQALTEHPFLQLGAAVVDAGLIYGGYRVLDAADQRINGVDDQPRTEVQINNSPNAQVTVSGDGSSNANGQSTDNSTAAPGGVP
ncbi:MAG: hypothetical protein V1929_00270 [bacterium]